LLINSKTVLLQPNVTSVFKDTSFNNHTIEQYIPLEPLDPKVFDYFCADGWCYWADSMFRRNTWEWKGTQCRVFLLRIVLKDFYFSKSQRKCLRTNSDLQTRVHSLRIRPEHELLFMKHAYRFESNRPQNIFGFFSIFSNVQPCKGLEFDVFKDHKLLATSFVHVGDKCMSGNYCIYDTEENHRSLGTYTMLRELEYAKKIGLDYYYPGFVYDVPSEFDYKLNFNNMEYYDWSGNWYPLERLNVRKWK
jgi:leucyl-tRNA---protein transferase